MTVPGAQPGTRYIVLTGQSDLTTLNLADPGVTRGSEALTPVRRGAMRLALLSAVVAALAMMLGLMRWPSVHWHLALELKRTTVKLSQLRG